MSGFYAKGDRGKADKLFSFIVRSRRVCEACGEQDYTKLQCAHIYSRKFSATRTDDRNALCLCSTCHWKFTNRPLEFAAFCQEYLSAEVLDDLFVKSHAVTKVDWAVEVVRLRALVREIEAAA